MICVFYLNQLPPKGLSGTAHLGWGLNHLEWNRVEESYKEEEGYLQNFEVVETLKNMAWDIPQLIPWDTPRGETQIFKRKEQKVNVKNEMHKFHNKLVPFVFFHVFELSCDMTSFLSPGFMITVNSQYANNNILFHSLWLLFA